MRRRSTPKGALAALLLLTACARPTPVEPAVAKAAEDPSLTRALEQAVEGITDPTLAALLRDHWAFTLEEYPLRATRLGVHAFDDRLRDDSHAGFERRRARSRELLARARALGPFDGDDAVNLALLVEQLDATIASDVCAFSQWTLNPRSNPVTYLNDLPETHAVTDASRGDKLVRRVRQGARWVDDSIDNLERGAARGLFAQRESAERVLAMVRRQLDAPIEDWPLLAPLSADLPGLTASERARFAEELRSAVEQEVRPALVRYAQVIESRIIPRARGDAESGLSTLTSIGEACYRARIRTHTTLPLSPEEIHAIGLEEITRIDGELVELGKRALGAETLEATLEALRTDRSLYFETEAEVQAAAEATLAEASAKLAGFFGVVPRAPCVVRRIPPHEAPFTTIAYYKPPHADGTKPGEYFVNTFEPSTRARFEARVLAVHEAIPGHHLQIALAQEQRGLPAFRKHGGVTAYVEGWALYTERLGDEMGLYPSDMDRIGVASFDAWRAGRLVVDTGIHALGWSRQQAKQFLLEHTALSPENVDNEVDRYIVWPGQALSYKLGQLEILKLREELSRELGERFSLSAFHDAVLATGPVSLPILRSEVRRALGAPRRP